MLGWGVLQRICARVTKLLEQNSILYTALMELRLDGKGRSIWSHQNYHTISENQEEKSQTMPLKGNIFSRILLTKDTEVLGQITIAPYGRKIWESQDLIQPFQNSLTSDHYQMSQTCCRFQRRSSVSLSIHQTLRMLPTPGPMLLLGSPSLMAQRRHLYKEVSSKHNCILFQ